MGIKMSELDINEIIHSGWFKDISESEIQKLIACSDIREFRLGERIYSVGQKSEYIYCILEGRVTLSLVEENGEEFGLTIWEAGAWFGEASLHEDGFMPIEAKISSDAKVLILPISAIEESLDNAVTFYKNITLDMIGRAKQLYQLVQLLLFRSLRARVAMRVILLIESFGENENGSMVLPIKFNQSDFAAMSGGSRQRVNQIFRRWAEAGIVKKENKRYVVHDIDALRQELNTTDD